MTMIKAWLANMLAILIAAGAAEGIVRVAIHPALDYTSDFIPGPYCSNPTLGISFNCPDHAGLMHQIGTNLYVPYALNEEGYRGPYASPYRNGHINNTVVIGGQSQMFGDGLLDDDTIGAAMARSSCDSEDFHIFSLPGLSNAQSWKLYDLSAEAKSAPDQIVLMIYGASSSDWRREMSPQSKLLDGPVALLYGWLYTMPQWLMDFSGSFLVVRSVTNIREPIYRFINRSREHMSRLVDRSVTIVREVASRLGIARDDTVKQDDMRRVSDAADPTQDLISAIFEKAQQLHARFSVVFLPGARHPWQVNADSIERALPDVHFIDVDAKAVALDLYPAQTLPDGHYNAALARFIGAEIGRGICPASRNASRRDSQAAPSLSWGDVQLKSNNAPNMGHVSYWQAD